MTYKIQINDLIRDATPAEVAQIEQAQAETAAQIAAMETAAAAKLSARAKLKTLGLTNDEIAALVG